ncbi:HlyIII-domain-containing protein [Leucogyrophana mollusca]|uniref:HlyIII-domain-containing protein n=1 Tax=Leucogyrophana mollusca TaxID=85980 RepID=A0ACB8BDL0_9AGAM|nr:HlyIII-domain-containing protein [Leucogyrophana mollusca]
MRKRKTNHINGELKSPVQNGQAEQPAEPLFRISNKVRTLAWHQIPEWQRDNEYIITGYRRVQNGWSGCIASIFGYLHNETVNIHSHLGGAVLFVWFLCTFQSAYISAYDSTTWLDTCVIAIFLLSAIFCLTASAVFHTATCHSEKLSSQCHALDYSGIVVLTVGSFVPCLYYGFYCEPVSQVVYLCCSCLAGLGAAYIVLNPEYAKPTHRGARTGVFIGLGLSAVVPVTHLLISHGVAKLLSEMGFGWLLTSGGLYITGALIYAGRLPERLAPGKFDFILASHQIFHLFVVLAALAHFTCVLTAFDHWHSGLGSCIS